MSDATRKVVEKVAVVQDRRSYDERRYGNERRKKGFSCYNGPARRMTLDRRLRRKDRRIEA